MHLREELSRLFEYDHWATMKWLPVAKELGADDVLLHMVRAQIIWLGRVEGRASWEPTIGNFAMDLDRSVRAWQRMLLGADLGHVISYVTITGEHYENTILEITRHVINHGTYHRGQFRGMAAERGIEFPETDYIAFCRERQRVGLG